MKRFITLFLLALLPGLAFLSCERKAEPEPEENLVRGSSLNKGSDAPIILTLSAEAQKISVTLTGKGDWTIDGEDSSADWVNVNIAVSSVKMDAWDVTVWLTENTDSETRSATFILSGKSDVRQLTVIQKGADPNTPFGTMGAYGVPGGNVKYDEGNFQYSRLIYGNGELSVRFLDPDKERVVILSGLPENPVRGTKFQLLYRVVQSGLTEISETYPVEVVRISGKKNPMILIKKDDDVYFVVKL